MEGDVLSISVEKEEKTEEDKDEAGTKCAPNLRNVPLSKSLFAFSQTHIDSIIWKFAVLLSQLQCCLLEFQP